MPVYTTYALGVSQISVSSGEQLSGITQGDGSHLVGETITLDSDAWEAVAIDDSEGHFDDNDNGQSLNGPQTFDGVSYKGGERVEAEYELTLQDPDGNSYTVLGFNVNEGGSGQSYSTVEGLAFVGGGGGFPPVGTPLTVTSASEYPSQPYADLVSPACFTAGSMIATPGGPVAVEELRPGDLVDTLDNGAQPLRWIGTLRVPAALLRADPRFRPVRIRRDAFGPGQPRCDSLLSQQHRVLISDWRAAFFFGEDEVLIPVNKLTNDGAVRVDDALPGVTYVHLLFDAHEIVQVDGLHSESFFPDAESDPPSPDPYRGCAALSTDRGSARCLPRRTCMHARQARLYPGALSGRVIRSGTRRFQEKSAIQAVVAIKPAAGVARRPPWPQPTAKMAGSDRRDCPAWVAVSFRGLWSWVDGSSGVRFVAGCFGVLRQTGWRAGKRRCHASGCLR